MCCPLMKPTIEIADGPFEQTQRLPRKAKTAVHALTRAGLRVVLTVKQTKFQKWKWKPETFRGGGLTDQFKNAGFSIQPPHCRACLVS